MTRVLVTGGSGNAGVVVSRALLDAGFAVRIADAVPATPGGGWLRETKLFRF